ncbi:MAG: outer membrane lipoprotein-sorting protein [Myxococcota bacterium]
MKRCLSDLSIALVVTAVFFVLGGTSFAQDREQEPEPEELPSVDQVIDKLDDLYRSDSSHGRMRMTITKERGTRKLEMESWSKGEDYFLVVIREPARESGTATLKTPDGLWNYAPRADRLIRIPSGLLSDNWMGSHFTNEDLVRETSYEKDYTTEIDWAKKQGNKYIAVTMTPRPDAPVVYEKLVFYLRPGDWLPVSTEYYDDGEVVREMRYSKIEEVDGRKIPTVMELQPRDADSNEKTRIEYLEMDFEADVDKRMFSKRGLRRTARRR